MGGWINGWIERWIIDYGAINTLKKKTKKIEKNSFNEWDMFFPLPVIMFPRVAHSANIVHLGFGYSPAHPLSQS